MKILLGSRRHDGDLRLLLSEPRKVEELLREVDEPWVDWLDFSTATISDDPSVSEALAQREGCVLWTLRTQDGVQAHIFVALDIEHGAIQVDYRLEEPESATLLRAFRPILDSKLASLGIDLSASRSIEEYRDTLMKSLEGASRGPDRDELP
jgi:hypothetical protein